jgi:hypothetical protein
MASYYQAEGEDDMNGYTDCACRDCFEIAIGEPGEAFCGACELAGCEDHQGVEGMSQECQVEPEPEAPECPACDGEGSLLGGLGNTTHYRCRNCGMGFSTETAS